MVRNNIQHLIDSGKVQERVLRQHYNLLIRKHNKVLKLDGRPLKSLMTQNTLYKIRKHIRVITLREAIDIAEVLKMNGYTELIVKHESIHGKVYNIKSININ